MIFKWFKRTTPVRIIKQDGPTDNEIAMLDDLRRTSIDAKIKNAQDLDNECGDFISSIAAHSLLSFGARNG